MDGIKGTELRYQTRRPRTGKSDTFWGQPRLGFAAGTGRQQAEPQIYGRTVSQPEADQGP